jgi:hypothetical protein
MIVVVRTAFVRSVAAAIAQIDVVPFDRDFTRTVWPGRFTELVRQPAVEAELVTDEDADPGDDRPIAVGPYESDLACIGLPPTNLGDTP